MSPFDRIQYRSAARTSGARARSTRFCRWISNAVWRTGRPRSTRYSQIFEIINPRLWWVSGGGRTSTDSDTLRTTSPPRPRTSPEPVPCRSWPTRKVVGLAVLNGPALRRRRFRWRPGWVYGCCDPVGSFGYAWFLWAFALVCPGDLGPGVVPCGGVHRSASGYRGLFARNLAHPLADRCPAFTVDWPTARLRGDEAGLGAASGR